MSPPFQMRGSLSWIVFHRLSLGHRRKDNSRQHYWKPQAKVAMCADAGQGEEEARCHHSCAQGAMAGGGGGGGALAAGGGGVKEALQCWEWLVTQWPGPARHLHLRI
eukprot:1160259-Pelagomonas_calceolata.AAC.3